MVLTFYVFFFFILEIQNKSGFVNEEDTAKNEKEEENKSPKDNIWSAIPVALLWVIVNWSEGKQGSGPKGDKVL